MKYIIHMSENINWKIVERPGYQGKSRDGQIARWNAKYGEKAWEIAWELRNGQMCRFEDMFYRFYVPGYVQHFLRHPSEALYLSRSFSYAIDKDPVSYTDAFDPFALYDKPGSPNQFHNVALNIALEYHLGLPFNGLEPIQVREGKPGSDSSTWPLGWRWSPGRIASVRQDLIPQNDTQGWWQSGSIEDLYQKAKVVRIRI